MTSYDREQIIAELLRENHEFKKLHKEHERLETQLEGLNGRVSLTASDEMERKNIQKKKLARKDRMEEILRQSQNSQDRATVV